MTYTIGNAFIYNNKYIVTKSVHFVTKYAKINIVTMLCPTTLRLKVLGTTIMHLQRLIGLLAIVIGS